MKNTGFTLTVVSVDKWQFWRLMTVDIPVELMKGLSAQERTVLYLSDAFNNLLEDLQSGYVLAKVDLAFASNKGLTFIQNNHGMKR